MNDWQHLQHYVENGDEAAFASIVQQHANLVFSAAFRQLGERSAAEEITQATFLLLVTKASKLKPTGTLGAWLFRAAHLKAKEYRTQERARQRRECIAMMLD